MTNTTLLQQLIRDSGLKKVFIAERLGMSPANFHNYLIGRYAFKESHMNVLCELLRIENPDLKEALFYADEVDKYSTGG